MRRRKTCLITTGIACCIMMAGPPLGAELEPFHKDLKLVPILHLDAYGVYSAADSGGDVWGADISGVIAPAVRYKDRLYIIPLYDGSYTKQRFLSHVEEGGLLYNQLQQHDFSLTAKYLATDRLTLNSELFGALNLNVETTDEDWGDGLYDYREFGGGLGLDYAIRNLPQDRTSFSTAVKWYIRKYPNYRSLISLATVTAPEENEKDYNAAELSCGLMHARPQASSFDLRYYLLLKYFTDKRVIDADGILKDENRREYRNTLQLDITCTPHGDRGIKYALFSAASLNLGNQNFYDSRGTATLSDDVFTADYYDYISLELHPVISYRIICNEKPGPVIIAGYRFIITGYLDRKAQTSSGAYTDDEQRDYEHTLEAGIEIPFNKYLSWVTRYDYTINKSNMDYEQYYEYDYAIHRISSGISFRY